MELKSLTYLLVGASFALYIGIAFWARAHNTRDFYIAGKGVSPIANGMATAADWMSAASFISMAGLIAFLGYDGSVYLMGWTGGYVLLALFLAPYLRKFGKFTVPEFIAERYYSKAARIVAVICLIFISFTYVAGQMRGVGIVFSRFLEVEITTGLVIGMGIEMEHTDDPKVALDIALDHLTEIPDYYTRLDKMEKEAGSMKKNSEEAKKIKAYVKVMQEAGVIE